MVAKGRGQKRSARRNKLQTAAAQVQVPEHVELCVVGAGASGLVAAITAAEQGAQVVVLERELECGRTILATGNGRCNFANEELDPELYNNPTFVSAACGPYWLDDILAFFSASGLAWTTEAQGRMYPLSRQAASVRNVLLARAARAGVQFAPLREATGSHRHNEQFIVLYRELFGSERTCSLTAERLIVSTGGGASCIGSNLGVAQVQTKAVLCPLACKGPALSELDGRRAQARTTLLRGAHTIACEEGEVLFRSFGLSGIVIFNLSRHAKPHDEIVLDLLPQLSLEEACRLAEHTLDGLLDPVIAQALSSHAVATTRDQLALAKHLRYEVVGTADESRSQVRRGGLSTAAFDPHTLCHKTIPDLYACGEALDIDGPCGGFNLAWAWKSGMVAGFASVEKEQR